MSKENNNWLLIGIPKNWETAFSHPVPIWGLRKTYKTEFQFLNVGDNVWFYATSPIKGVIGSGVVRDKYIDNVNLVWEEELRKKEVIWPLRFRIQILKAISPEQWKTNSIEIDDFNLFLQRGFQLLSNEHLAILIKRFENTFGPFATEDFFSGATITQPLIVKEKPPIYTKEHVIEEIDINHRKLQENLAEIGKLQFYHTQLEYPIDLPGENKNIDVVWKREISGVPTIAFEIELSGGIERAITRLRFAYMQWNSRPRVVIPKKFIKKVNNIITTESRNFSQQFKIYEPIQVIELLNKKRELKTLEQNLGIY